MRRYQSLGDRRARVSTDSHLPFRSLHSASPTIAAELGTAPACIRVVVEWGLPGDARPLGGGRGASRRTDLIEKRNPGDFFVTGKNTRRQAGEPPQFPDYNRFRQGNPLADSAEAAYFGANRCQVAHRWLIINFLPPPVATVPQPNRPPAHDEPGQSVHVLARPLSRRASPRRNRFLDRLQVDSLAGASG